MRDPISMRGVVLYRCRLVAPFTGDTMAVVTAR
jgi:hypothetical protein